MTRPFPKTLFGFYIRHAAKGFYPVLILWTILYMGYRVASDVLWPLFQKWFVELFEQTPPDGITFMEFALPTIIMITAGWLILDSINVIRSMIEERWQPKIRNNISVILNDYAHSQSMSFWTSRMSGKINAQIGYVAGGWNSGFRGLMTILASGVAILANLGMIISVNGWIALILGGVFLFRLIYSLALMRPMNKASKMASESSSQLSGKVIDSITNYYLVKLFAARRAEKKYMDGPRKKAIDDRLIASFFQRLFWAVPSFVWDLAFVLVMVACIMLYAKGAMKVSDIVFSMSVYFSVMSMISNIVERIPDLVDVMGSAQKSYEELVMPIEITDEPDAKELKVSGGAVEIKNVSFRYHKRPVLDNFSLSIRAGEKVGLVGTSGAGKTTLVNLLMRLYDPASGGIFVDGQNIAGVTQDSLRENIAFIPQESTLFNRTLSENIAYGRPSVSIAEIKKAAKKAEADEFIMASPKKYNSLVGDRGIKLSGGQKQRVAIARAFLKDAPVLILDEATSALDSETERAIQKSFAELSKGRTTIVIAHRLSTLRNMDRIVVMEKGKIAEKGSHIELLKKGGIYARLWKMQSGGFISE